MVLLQSRCACANSPCIFVLYLSLYTRWEGTVALRKIFLAGIGVFGSDMGDMQVLLTLVLVVGVIVMTATVRPYSTELANKEILQNLEMASLLAIFLTLWAGTVFSKYPKCEDPVDGSKTIFWCDCLSVIVGCLDFFMFGLMILSFVAVKCFGSALGNLILNSKASKNISRSYSTWKKRKTVRISLSI